MKDVGSFQRSHLSYVMIIDNFVSKFECLFTLMKISVSLTIRANELQNNILLGVEVLWDF